MVTRIRQSKTSYLKYPLEMNKRQTFQTKEKLLQNPIYETSQTIVGMTDDGKGKR